MSELELQRIQRIVMILCLACYMPNDWHLLVPFCGLLLEARSIYQSKPDQDS